MRLTPKEPEIGTEDGFTEDNDLFRYAEFGERFANLVGSIDEPLVIVLDGPWGSGKSVFAKQWAGLLRDRGAPVIEFDAFANDFYEDAFVALSAQIYAQAKTTLKASEDLPEGFLDKSKKLGKAHLPTVLRVLTRAVTAGLVSLEEVQAGGDAVKAGIEALGSEGEKAIDAALTERLTKANEDQQEMDAFKQTLSELAEAMMAANKKEGATGEENQKDGEGNEEGGQQAERREYPLVFIIDELDRCRPPFALSVIERIKHLFSVDGVCFVLVTHLPQLETAVQGVYGSKIDAANYLQKFYHLRVPLPVQLDRHEQNGTAYVRHLLESIEIKLPEKHQYQRVHRALGELTETYNLTLRELERIMTHIALVTASTGPQHLFPVPVIVGLCVMRVKQPALYRKAQLGSLSWDQALGFLKPNVDAKDFQSVLAAIQDDRTLDWWAYALGAELQDRISHQIDDTAARYGLVQPYDIIEQTCKYIDDFVLVGQEESGT